jgi:acyl-CoA dehydrogenase
MVDFKLTEDQTQYQDLAREFALNEIAPFASKHDHSGDIAESICRKAWEIGLMNLHIPEEYGGIGLSVFDGCVITQELAKACAAISCTINANNLALTPLLLAGNESQKQEFLGGLASEFSFAAYCAQEDSNNSWGTQCNTEARQAVHEFVINGKKIAVANAEQAKWFLVIAREKESSLSAFIVPNHLPGISISTREKSLGLRAYPTNTVSFQDVKIPSANLVGQIGQGWELVIRTRSRFYPLIASTCVGLAKASLEFAAEYAKARQTFGQPIANHQAIRLMIADMAKDIEGARLLALEAAMLADHNVQSNASTDRLMANAQPARMAKSFAQDASLAVSTNALQIYGGYGYSKEYPVEKLMRDAKCLQLFEGTSNHEQVTIAQEFALSQT